jgi:hypothetical protein
MVDRVSLQMEPQIPDTAAADVDRDAGLINGFAAVGVDVHEHLADRAAEGCGVEGSAG